MMQELRNSYCCYGEYERSKLKAAFCFPYILVHWHALTCRISACVLQSGLTASLPGASVSTGNAP
jgi:hypothetical protein